MEKKKYQIDFGLGCANYYYETQMGNETMNRFQIFVDSKGLKIFTQNGVEYLTEKNSEVL